jgi:hypothetical protein
MTDWLAKLFSSSFVANDRLFSLIFPFRIDSTRDLHGVNLQPNSEVKPDGLQVHAAKLRSTGEDVVIKVLIFQMKDAD